MVPAPVNPVYHRIGRAAQFIIEATIDQSSNDEIDGVFPRQHPGGRGTVDLLLSQPSVDALDDVIALAEPSRSRAAWAYRLTCIARYG